MTNPLKKTSKWRMLVQMVFWILAVIFVCFIAEPFIFSAIFHLLYNESNKVSQHPSNTIVKNTWTTCNPEAKAAILMYHYIRDENLDASGSSIWRLSISPKIFTKQLEEITSLKKSGEIDFMKTSDLAAWKTQNICPSNAKNFVIFTSDDGWKDSYTDLMPIAHKFGIPFSFSLISGKIEHGNNQKTGFINENETKSLISAWWEILSHSVNHEDFKSLTLTWTEEEICKSKRSLESRFHIPITFFVYPAWHMNTYEDVFLQKCHYDFALTTQEGTITKEKLIQNPYSLPRIRITKETEVTTLLQKIFKI